jgi:hypothetical protein
MKHQDNEPSDNPTDRADEHGKHVDGYVIRQYEVSEEQEDHPDNPIDDEPPQKTSASRQQKQDHYHNHYEYDEFHQGPFYMSRWSLLGIAAKKEVGCLSSCPYFTALLKSRAFSEARIREPAICA